MFIKRKAALLIAIMMIISMMGACSTDTSDNGSGDTTADTGETDVSVNTGVDETAGQDTSAEDSELATITWLGEDVNSGDYTSAEIAELPTTQKMLQLMKENYDVTVDWSLVDPTTYVSTLTSLIAAGTLPDAFYSKNDLSDETVLNCIEQNKFASFDDILQYSDGTCRDLFYGGSLSSLRGMASMSDGNWYYLLNANTTGMNIDFSDEYYGEMHCSTQVHGAYSMNMRQDWLDDCDLDMPSTIDEFEEALVAFQDNDCNGNGQRDERLVSGLGSEYQYQGVAQWFGLGYMDFMEHPCTGKVEVNCLMDGYDDYVSYMNRLYDDGVVYVEGEGMWTTVFKDIYGNYMSAMTMMQNTIWSIDIGEEGCNYRSTPIIQAVDGITPRLLLQESVAYTNGISSPVGSDYEVLARFYDYLHSKDFYMVSFYGVEGVAWDWNDDGTVTTYADCDIGAKDCKYSGKMIPYPLCGIEYSVSKVTYEGAEDALAHGEPYTENFTTKEQWCQDYNSNEHPVETFLNLIVERGVGNYNPCAYYSYSAQVTDEEADFFSSYKTDLTTYLTEMTTNLCTGQTDVSDIDSMIQYAYDNLELQQYIDYIQVAVNRYLETVGKTPYTAES